VHRFKRFSLCLWIKWSIFMDQFLIPADHWTIKPQLSGAWSNNRHQINKHKCHSAYRQRIRPKVWIRSKSFERALKVFHTWKHCPNPIIIYLLPGLAEGRHCTFSQLEQLDGAEMVWEHRARRLQKRNQIQEPQGIAHGRCRRRLSGRHPWNHLHVRTLEV
jgi:hypothetical protein